MKTFATAPHGIMVALQNSPRVALTTGGPAPRKEVVMQPQPTGHTWPTRFWKYATPAAPDQCWEWQGYRTTTGYGKLSRGPRGAGHIKAHDLEQRIMDQLWLRTVLIEQRRRIRVSERQAFDARADRMLAALDPQEDPDG